MSFSLKEGFSFDTCPPFIPLWSVRDGVGPLFLIMVVTIQYNYPRSFIPYIGDTRRRGLGITLVLLLKSV